MPTPVVTLEDIISDVKIVLGYIDDGVADPLLEQHIIGAANVAQRQLEVEHSWCRMRRAYSTQINSLQRYLDLPEEATRGTIEKVIYTASDGTVVGVVAGIDPTLENISGIPRNFDITPTTGIVSVTVTNGGTGYADNNAVAVTGGTMSEGGSEPEFTLVTSSGVITSVTVTNTGAAWSAAPTLTPGGGTSGALTAVLGPVQVLELFPSPDGGTISLEYRAGATDLVEESDAISIDRQALVGRVAWLVASSPARRMANTDALLAAHNAYLSKAADHQRPSNGMSLTRNLTIPHTTLYRNW